MREKKAGKHSKKTAKPFLNIAIIVCALGAVICVGILLSSYFEYKKGDDLMDGMTQYVTIPQGDNGENEAFIVDYDALAAINPDFIGWLYLDGTVINYPVVQGEDNSYYLNHVFEGEQHKYGSIFMDSRNHARFWDTNTVIYGHRMNSGAMFGTLIEYKNQEYYDQHPVFMLYTKEQVYRLEIFAAYEVDAKMENVPFNFATDEQYRAYLDSAIAQSNIQTDVSVEVTDRIVTLSTCTKTSQSKRFIVQAKLVAVSE